MDLYAPDFQKSSVKDFFCTEVLRKHGFRCFTAMCIFWMECFLKKYYKLLNFLYFYKLYFQCIVDKILLLICNNRFYMIEVGFEPTWLTCVSSRHSQKYVTLLKLMTELNFFSSCGTHIFRIFFGRNLTLPLNLIR